jgi:hypothetical protein
MKNWIIITVLFFGLGNFSNAVAQSDTIEWSISGKIFSIPSPIQFYQLLQNEGIDYNIKITHQPTKVSGYTTETAMALNMGVYLADWSWEITSGKVSELMYHFNPMWILAKKLNVVHQEEEAYRKRILNNLENSDSLQILTSELVRGMTRNLQENNRTNVKRLILTGTWVEAFYHIIYYTPKKPELREDIAMQKGTLGSIIYMLYDEEANKEYFGSKNSFGVYLLKLEQIYKEVDSEYVYGEPKTNTAEKVTTLGSKMTMNLTDDQLDEITEQTKILRTRIIEQ